MDSTEYSTLRNLYHLMAGKPVGERGQIFAELSVEGEMRREVEALLDHVPTVRELQEENLGGAILDPLLRGITPRCPVPDPPATIGGYRVVEVIGSGGMGTVYRCEQARPRRDVAIKVLHDSLTSPEAVRRFQYEAEVLAGLDHPFIAKIIELGMDPTNRTPFMVMELVDGLDLVEHCDRTSLDLRARVRLLEQVCDAVAHAHRSGVVHRDLKPANILISKEGRPCIVDFGIARAAAGSRIVGDRETRAGSVLGSVEWMSPEQARGDVALHDARTDVYTLGVVLYQLLAGVMPYDLQRASPWEAAHIICDVVPVPLRTHGRALRGDLEAIVAKAIEKDPDRRYESASSFRADLLRYLAGLPVVARQWTTTYHVGRLARRHWAIALSLTSVLIVLVAGVIAGFLLWRSAEVARRDADHEASVAKRQTEVSQRVVDFMTGSFGRVPSETQTGDQVTVKSMLDQAVAELEIADLGDPLLEAELLVALGEVYAQLGLFTQAVPLLDEAVEIQGRAGASVPPATLIQNRGLLASVLWEAGRLTEAMSVYESCVPEARATLGDEDDRTIEVIRAYAGLLSDLGRHTDARAVLESALESARRDRGDRDRTTIDLIAGLVVVLLQEHRLEEAEALAREAYEARLQDLGPLHYLTTASGNSLATVYMEMGDLVRAEPIAKSVMLGMQDELGPSHPYTLIVSQNLANLYLRAGRLSESDELYAQVVLGLEKSLGIGHQDTLKARHGRARLRLAQGRVEEARDQLLELVVATEEALGEDHADVVELFLTLAQLEHGRSSDDEEACLREALSRSRADLGPAAPRSLNVLVRLIQLLIAQSRWSDGIEIIGDALELAVEDPGLDEPRVQRLLLQYVRCQLELGETELANAMLNRLEQVAQLEPRIDSAAQILRTRMSEKD